MKQIQERVRQLSREMAISSLAFNLLLSTVIGCDLVFCYKHVISIDASNGHDDSSCLQRSGPSCQTLEYVQKHLKSVSSGSLEIEICQPGINLTKAINITNITNLAIVGAENSNWTFIQCNTSGSGLTFINVTGLSLNYIQLFGCGAERDYSVSDMSTEVSALALLNCRDVNITNTLVQLSNGTGIYIDDGNVLIDNTTVLESYLKASSSAPGVWWQWFEHTVQSLSKYFL